MGNVSRQTDHEVVVFLSACTIASHSGGLCFFFLHCCGMTSGLELIMPVLAILTWNLVPLPLPARPGWNGKNKLAIWLFSFVSCLLVQHKVIKCFKIRYLRVLVHLVFSCFLFPSWWADTNMVDAPHVLNVILPENQTHLLHQVGYILAIFLLLLLMLIGIILTMRHCRKKGRIMRNG